MLPFPSRTPTSDSPPYLSPRVPPAPPRTQRMVSQKRRTPNSHPEPRFSGRPKSRSTGDLKGTVGRTSQDTRAPHGRRCQHAAPGLPVAGDAPHSSPRDGTREVGAGPRNAVVVAVDVEEHGVRGPVDEGPGEVAARGAPVDASTSASRPRVRTGPPASWGTGRGSYENSWERPWGLLGGPPLRRLLLLLKHTRTSCPDPDHGLRGVVGDNK